MQKYENQAIDQIKSNDILTLKVPFVFGDYHYMVAVISITRKKVNIYQSYGSSVKLFEIKNLDFNLFIQMLYNCQKINNEPANYIHHMKLLKEISYILYRIPNIECIWYRDDFVPEYDYSDHVEFEDDANAEEQREKRREKRLGFSDYSSETIKRNYQLMKERGNNFNMTIWRAPTKEDKEE